MSRKTANTSDDNWMKPQQAAKYIGLSNDALKKQRHRKSVCAIPYYRITPRVVLYKKSDLDVYLATRQIRHDSADRPLFEGILDNVYGA